MQHGADPSTVRDLVTPERKTDRTVDLTGAGHDLKHAAEGMVTHLMHEGVPTPYKIVRTPATSPSDSIGEHGR